MSALLSRLGRLPDLHDMQIHNRHPLRGSRCDALLGSVRVPLVCLRKRCTQWMTAIEQSVERDQDHGQPSGAVNAAIMNMIKIWQHAPTALGVAPRTRSPSITPIRVQPFA